GMRNAGSALAERKQNPTEGKVEIEEHLRPDPEDPSQSSSHAPLLISIKMLSSV
ncbi:hypothetical protein DPX16_3786, partial [Anabarilius grahami]